MSRPRRLLALHVVVLQVVALIFACAPPPGGDDDPSTGDGGGGGGGGGGSSGTPPALTSAEARISGRHGLDLTVVGVAVDPEKDLSSLRARFLDANGAPVPLFDLDLDGKPETAEGAAELSVREEADRLQFDAVFWGLLKDRPAVSTLELWLYDETSLASSTLSVPLNGQPVRALGEGCDPTYRTDRCAPSLGCRGQPTACQEGVAPSLTRGAYLSSPFGALVLADGAEPDDDIAYVKIDFQDLGGNAVLIDLDNDEVAEASSMQSTNFERVELGRFLLKIEPTEEFRAKVSKLAFTPFDSAGRRGATVTATLSSPPARGVGQSCDIWGFNACTAGAVCTLAADQKSYACSAAGTLRTQACGKASAMELSGPGTARATGQTGGGSLWDPPAGCSTGAPGRFDGLAMLRLKAKANKVTVTTSMPGTTFDTVVYVFPNCTNPNAAALVCNDDEPRLQTSRVELSQLAAGDYVIVVDAWGTEGGAFEVGVTVE